MSKAQKTNQQRARNHSRPKFVKSIRQAKVPMCALLNWCSTRHLFRPFFVSFLREWCATRHHFGPFFLSFICEWCTTGHLFGAFFVSSICEQCTNRHLFGPLLVPVNVKGVPQSTTFRTFLTAFETKSLTQF